MYIIPEIFEKCNPFIETAPRNVAKLYRENKNKSLPNSSMYDEEEYDNVNINTDIPEEVLNFAFSEMNTHGKE